MATPPARASLFPAGALTPANAKTYFGQLYDYIYALLGTTGNTAEARNALAVPVYNYLLNPDGAVYQRAVAAATDDTYIDDRWYILTQTASATPSQVSNPEDGFRYGLRLTQSQAAAQRMGRAQILEGKDTSALRGKTVTFGGRFKLSTSATLRYAIVAWTGTEDAPTSDIVLDWTNATFTAGNFFTATNCSLVATGSTALTANAATTCSVSGAVPSGATNLVCFYWTEAVAAQNVTLDVWDLRLVDATSLVGVIKRSWADELRLCQRFYEKTYSYSVAPGAVSALGAQCSQRTAIAITDAWYSPFQVMKRIPPTMGVYSPATGASGKVAGSASGEVNAAYSSIGEHGASVSTSANVALNEIVTFHWTASAEL